MRLQSLNLAKKLAFMKSESLYERLLEFLEIDEDARTRARFLGELLEPHFAAIINNLYSKVIGARVSAHISPQTVERLKPKQIEHWRALFRTTFDEDYSDSVRRIGIKHRDVDLDPAWYIAAYAILKMDFTNVIVKSDLTVVEKGHLIRTMDKYLAIDMGVSLSAFHATLLLD